MNTTDNIDSKDGEPPEGIAQAVIALIWGKPWTPYFIAFCAFLMVSFAIWQSLPDETKLRLLRTEKNQQISPIEPTLRFSGGAKYEDPDTDPLAEIDRRIYLAESTYDRLDGLDTHKSKIDLLPETYPKAFDVSFNPFGEVDKQSRTLMRECLRILRGLESYDLTESEREIAKKAHSWSTGLSASPSDVYMFSTQLTESLVNRREAVKRELNSLKKEKDRVVNGE